MSSEAISSGAAELLALMIQETRLPHDWEISGFWLAYAQNLAQFMDSQKGKIPFDDAAMLLGLGGILVEMAKREREAAFIASR